MVGGTRRVDGLGADGGRTDFDAEQSRHDARHDQNDENDDQADDEAAEGHANVLKTRLPIACVLSIYIYICTVID